MKLTHPETDLEIDVPEFSVETYASQGWRPATVEAPPGNASLEVWQDFARSEGFDESDPAFGSRDALRAALS